MKRGGAVPAPAPSSLSGGSEDSAKIAYAVTDLGGAKMSHFSMKFYITLDSKAPCPAWAVTPSSFAEALESTKISEAYVAPEGKWGKTSGSRSAPHGRSLPAPPPATWPRGSFADLRLRSCVSEAPQTFRAAVPSSGSLWAQASPGFVPSHQGPGLQEHQPLQSPEPGSCGLGCFLRPGVAGGRVKGLTQTGREASCERGFLAGASVLNRARQGEGRSVFGQRPGVEG